MRDLVIERIEGAVALLKERLSSQALSSFRGEQDSGGGHARACEERYDQSSNSTLAVDFVVSFHVIALASLIY